MKYYKVNIDEMHQEKVFFEYREITEDVKAPLIARAFPLAKLGALEPKFLDLVAGSIIGIYYESRGSSEVRETNWLDKRETISDEDVAWLINATERACINKEWDDILKPPTVDEQVEDFIKEFFDNDEDNKPLEQKDFLAEFFAELENDSTS
jgi:hypothetical protein